MLSEISETLARIDTEPKFFTFTSLSNLGKETYLKLTDPDYTQQLDTDVQGNFKYKYAYKRELANDEVFETVFDLIMDGICDKDELFEATIAKHPKTSIS
jgi:hypothetical protein